MDLFEYAKSKTLDRESPLASRLRPTTLDEVVGQEHIVGKDKLLYRAIKADKLTSVIFYGPPGTGKTTLAKVIANTTSASFTQINATVAGKFLPAPQLPTKPENLQIPENSVLSKTILPLSLTKSIHMCSVYSPIISRIIPVHRIRSKKSLQVSIHI